MSEPTTGTTVISGAPHDPLDDLRRLPLPDFVERQRFSDIRYETAEGIARITICRPEVRNAFRPQTLFELSDAFDLARDDPDVGVVVLHRRGPRRLLLGRRPADPRRRRLPRRRRGGPPGDRPAERAGPADPDPTAAQAGGGRVAGYAIGGGHILHLVCDLTIAADNARFGQTGPRVGSFDGGYGSGLLARTIGLKRAKEVWFLCRQYDAAQALRVGAGQRGGARSTSSRPRRRPGAARCSPSRRSPCAC